MVGALGILLSLDHTTYCSVAEGNLLVGGIMLGSSIKAPLRMCWYLVWCHISNAGGGVKRSHNNRRGRKLSDRHGALGAVDRVATGQERRHERSNDKSKQFHG